MKEEHRHQLILAAIQSPHVPGSTPSRICEFVDGIEKYEDMNVLKRERIMVETTFESIRDALTKGRDGLREILPAVLTFKGIVALSAQSTLSINLQAKFATLLKSINGPAAITTEDAENFLGFFKESLPKYDEEISKLARELK